MRYLLAICLLLWLGGSAWSADHEKLGKAYRLIQKSHVAGDFEVLVSADGIRITKSKAGLVLVAKKPDWVVYQFSPQTKHFYSDGKRTVSGSGLLTAATAVGSPLLTSVPLRKTGKRDCLGVKAMEYATDQQFTKSQSALYLKHAVNGDSPCIVHYVALDDDSVPAEAASILSDLTGLTSLGHLPLSANYQSVDAKPHPYFSTKVVQMVSARKEDFSLPPGLQKVEREGLVLSDQEDENGLMMLFGSKHSINMGNR